MSYDDYEDCYSFAAKCPYCGKVVTGFIGPHSIDRRTNTTRGSVLHRCEYCHNNMGMRGIVVGNHIRITETGDGAKMSLLDMAAVITSTYEKANVRPSLWERLVARILQILKV